ncbi:hypothetical protein Tco_1546829 [Tanacetum coccineum]
MIDNSKKLNASIAFISYRQFPHAVEESYSSIPLRSKEGSSITRIPKRAMSMSSRWECFQLLSGKLLNPHFQQVEGCCQSEEQDSLWLSLEMLHVLKDHLDAKERKQDKCPLETPLDFEEGVFDDEVQQNEAIPLSDEEIALDASSEGTMSSGIPTFIL